MSYNTVLAGMLREIASLHDQTEPNAMFKIRAYLRAAKVVEEIPKDVAEYGDEKALMKLPGIGEAIAKKIIEYVKTGNIETLEKLRRAQKGVSTELLSVENLGPKRAKQIASELGITTVAELIAAAEAGKLRSLPRMSALMEKKILESARLSTQRSKRFPRIDVEKTVMTLLDALRDVPGVDRAEAAGSYRRKKETVGDIDVLVVTTAPERVAEAISALPFVTAVAAHGDKKLSFDMGIGTDDRIRVDVRFVEASQWGSALLYFTGSKENNIHLRQLAIKNCWKLSEYGLFDASGKIIASREEEDIYRALGMMYQKPEER